MRRALAVSLLALVTGWLVAGLAAAAPAADGDTVDSFKITYDVTADGVLHVREDIVYGFGSTGRNGIYRDLITREKYVDDTSKDQVYDVSNVQVSSPSGDSAEFTLKTTKSEGGREQQLRLKIGSADRVIDKPTASYVIMYDVRGALRHFADHSELYWDATGGGWDAELQNVSVVVTVPQGVRRVECFAGGHGSTSSCTSTNVAGGKGVFGQRLLDRKEQLTVVSGIAAGAVRNDTPIVVDPPDFMERNNLSVPLLAGAGAISLGVPVAGSVLARRSTRDDRFAGFPPGALPPAGMDAAVSKNSLSDDQVPVAFAPPKIAVAEAGLLIDAVANTQETAATLIDLAVRGGIRIENTGDEQRAVLLDAAVATAPHEQALVSALYPSLQPGESVTLERRKAGDSSMRKAHDALVGAVRKQVTAAGYYNRMPSRAYGAGLGAAWVVGIAVVIGVFHDAVGKALDRLADGGGLNGAVVVVAGTALVVLGTLVLATRARGKGRRTAIGRAMTDQTLGFRTYLETAEADQLKFEEGEDIFSRSCPGRSSSTSRTAGRMCAHSWSPPGGSPPTRSGTTGRRTTTPAGRPGR